MIMLNEGVKMRIYVDKMSLRPFLPKCVRKPEQEILSTLSSNFVSST